MKQVFIPLIVLGKGRGEVLELYVESRWLNPTSCFTELTGYGLDNGVELAKKVIDQLHIKTAKSMIYTGNAQPLLSNSLGTAAGLVVASVICSKSCHYQTVIINAAVEDSSTENYPLKYNSFWLEKLAAVLTLPVQDIQTPFILAADTPLSGEQTQQLSVLNIQPILVDNLKQAIDFCLTPKST